MKGPDDTSSAVRKIPKSDRNRWPVGDRTFLERHKWTIAGVATPLALLGVVRLLPSGTGGIIELVVAIATISLLAGVVGFAVAGVLDFLGRFL